MEMISIWTQLLLVMSANALWDDPDKDFEIFNKSTCIFADKTSMIHEFFQYTETTSKYQVFTSPLGFGKTTNLKMLKRFVQIEIDEFGEKVNKRRTSAYKLFSDKKLHISSHRNTIKAHLAEYPVLYFDYSDVMEFSFPKTYRNICARIRKLFKSYEWVYEKLQEKYSSREDESAINFKVKLIFMRNMIKAERCTQNYIQKHCLCVLVEILHEYFQKKVFVFIEYYDRYWFDGEKRISRLWDIYTKGKFFLNEDCYDLAYLLFRPGMDKYIEYVFATGTHPIYLKNDYFTYNSFLGDHPFVEYYGFTKEEVTKILNPRAKAPITEFKQLRLNHNGYKIRTGDLKLFQPSSIIDYFLPLSKSSSSIEHSTENHDDERAPQMTYELKPYLLIDPPPLDGQWKALQIQSIREKVRDLVSKGNTTFELRFETTNGTRNLPENLKTEPHTQKITIDLFFSMLFENGYFTYTTVPGWYRISNQSRLKMLKYYLKVYREQQQKDDQEEIQKSWRQYMKENRLI